jgi:hypothetical protein
VKTEKELSLFSSDLRETIYENWEKVNSDVVTILGAILYSETTNIAIMLACWT